MMSRHEKIVLVPFIQEHRKSMVCLYENIEGLHSQRRGIRVRRACWEEVILKQSGKGRVNNEVILVRRICAPNLLEDIKHQHLCSHVVTLFWLTPLAFDLPLHQLH